jgi:hypothetical protein
MTKDTKYKIGEAEFFLDMMKCYRDRYVIREGGTESFIKLKYVVGAFLCSARSVLDYMKREYQLDDSLCYKAVVYGFKDKKNKVNKKFRDLAPEEQEEIQALCRHFKELRYFKDLRNEHVHRDPDLDRCYTAASHDPMTLRERTCACPMGLVVVNEGCVMPDQQSVQTQTPESTSTVKMIVFLKEPGWLKENTEVVEFCERNLNVIKQLVKLCEEGKFDLPNLMKVSVECSNCLDC